MNSFTVDQYRAGARKALAAGDIATAKKLIARGMALQAQQAQQAQQNTTEPVPENMANARAARAGTLAVSPASAARHKAYTDAGMAGPQMKPASVMDALSTGVVQGATLGYGDEILAGIYTAINGGDYETARRMFDSVYQKAQADRPVTTGVSELAGSVAVTAPLAAAAAPKALAIAPKALAGQMALAAGTGATAGSVEGFVRGAGKGEPGNRMESGIKEAKSGALLGGAFGAAAPIVARGASTLVEYAKRTDVAAISKALGISPKAAQGLKADLEALDFNAAARNLDIAGPDAMLADAGLPMRQALDTAITGGGKAARIGVDAVAGRAAKAGANLQGVMDATLGKPEGIRSVAKGIATRTASARQAAYDAAYNTAIDYADNAGRDIEAVMRRIPPRTLQAAIAEANDAMRAAGVKNRQIMADIGKDGSVTFREMPNTQQLDEIKKALGAVARSEVDQFGRPTAAGKRARQLAGELRDAIGTAVPAYGRAVKLGGDKIAEDEALDLGRKLFSPATTREDVRAVMKGASLEAQDAARRGIREYLDDTLARVRRSVDDPDVDIAETKRLLNTLSSRDAREKIAEVLGPAKAARLFWQIDTAGKHFGTAAAIAKGSDTARRTERLAGWDAATARGPLGNVQAGEVKLTAKSLVQLLTRETPEALRARKQEVLAEAAAALTSIRGQDAKDALLVIQKAMSGQPVKSADAARIGRLFATQGALVGYQTTRQSLATRQGAQ